MRGPPSSGRTRSKGGAGGWCGCRSCPALRRPSCSRGCAARHLEGPAMKLLVATRNEGKIREIRDLFTGLPFELTFPVDQFLERLPDEADLERGTSFAENAVAKARYFAKRGTIPTLAEDSGLEVDALEGAPGGRRRRSSACRIAGGRFARWSRCWCGGPASPVRSVSTDETSSLAPPDRPARSPRLARAA